MSLSWPWALLALLAIPLVIAAWWWTRRRRCRGAVRVTSIALVRASLPGRNRWRRLIPAALLLLGLAVLGVGAARPQATVRVPSSSGAIMLALDVSGSMCSTDVQSEPHNRRRERGQRLHQVRGGRAAHRPRRVRGNRRGPCAPDH